MTTTDSTTLCLLETNFPQCIAMQEQRRCRRIALLALLALRNTNSFQTSHDFRLWPAAHMVDNA